MSRWSIAVPLNPKTEATAIAAHREASPLAVLERAGSALVVWVQEELAQEAWVREAPERVVGDQGASALGGWEMAGSAPGETSGAAGSTAPEAIRAAAATWEQAEGEVIPSFVLRRFFPPETQRAI